MLSTDLQLCVNWRKVGLLSVLSINKAMPSKGKLPDGKSISTRHPCWGNSFRRIKEWLIKNDLKIFCPLCGIELYVRGGEGKSRRLHFAHTRVCSTTMEHHPESGEHEEAKHSVVDEIEALIQDKGGEPYSVELEYPLPKCGLNGRVADVAILLEGKPFVVIECQLSPVPLEKLIQRINDYKELGLRSWWFLGEKANSPENRQALCKYADFLGFIEITSAYATSFTEYAERMFE